MTSVPSNAELFQPLKLGNMSLQHRVVMAPLTRFRANDQHVHTDLAVEYYAQRASIPGTMLITEATFISADAGGGPNVPGIWNDAQIASWKKVTDAVHAKGSFIVSQLWALGRGAYTAILAAEGHEYVGASSIPLSDRKDEIRPRPLTTAEIEGYVQKYARAAKNAIAAGFDGVELHGANGYLIDQFLQDVSNNRTDEYGGSIENRTRFAREVIGAVAAAIGEERTALRLSPWSRYQDMRMKDPIPTFSYLIESLKKSHGSLLYLHLIEARSAGIDDDKAGGEKGDYLEVGSLPDDYTGPAPVNSTEFARKLWQPRPYITAGGYTNERERAVRAGEYGVLVAFGRGFIANPDLPRRLKEGIALNPYDRATFFAPTASATGYTDQPFAE